MKPFNLILTTLFILAAHCVRGQIAWQSVEQVYDDLITAVGDGSKIAPPIKSSRTESRVAYYSPSKQTVYVEEKFLALCAEFGPDSLNALAFILGHELAHFYRGHGWVSTNGMGYVDAEMKADWKAMRRDETNHAKDESEADIFSGFYALVAGYDAISTAGNTLQKVYAAYGIPDSVPGYPSLPQRVEISSKAKQQAHDLHILFKTGLYCLSTEKYEVAIKLFESIYNKEYAGAEILNNLAIAHILLGYSQLNEDVKLVFPVLLSTQTNLDPNSRGDLADAHINKGINYLKIASEKEPNASEYQINLACAFAMLNKFTDAKYHLAKAEELGASENDVVNLKGILAFKLADSKAAKKLWKSTQKEDPFAAKNYNLIFGKNVEDGTFADGQAADLPEIDDVALDDPSLRSKFQFEVIKLPGLKVSYIELEHSILIELYAGSGVDYRFQSFAEKTPLANGDFAWEQILSSSTENIYKSHNFNALKFSNQAKSEVVKFVWY